MLARLVALPRLVRIALVAFNALSAVLAIFALVDRIYIQYLMTPQTVVLPSYVSVAMGLVMYIWGWLLLVGQRRKRRPVQAALGFYVVVAIVAFCINIVLILQGVSMLDAFAG